MTPHPISLNHPDYDVGAPKWRRCRDVCGGSDKVKAGREKYLPRLSSQKGKDAMKYDAYLNRALFYNAARRTRIGLSGAATLRPPKINANGTAENDYAKLIAASLSRPLVDEALEVGRYAVVVNQSDRDPPFFTRWWAESIVNWDYESINGQYVLVLLVLEDTETVRTDIFKRETKTIRHAYTMKDGVCQYAKFARDDKVEGGWTQTEKWGSVESIGGRTLDHIPARIFSAMSSDEPEIEDPLLLDLVDVNISHYQNSADLEHGRHWTALPTAVAIGFPTIDREGQPVEFTIGGESAWMTDQPGASAHYLEFGGSGLGHLATGMTDKQAMMAVLGARLLEEQKASVEAAETIKTRLTGEKSVLSRVASVVSDAMTWTLREMIRFTNPAYVDEDDKDTIDLNTEFLDKALNPSQVASLVSLLQANAISYSTMFALLQGAEIVPEDRTLEDEIKLIDGGNPGKKEDPFVGGGGNPFGGN